MEGSITHESVQPAGNQKEEEEDRSNTQLTVREDRLSFHSYRRLYLHLHTSSTTGQKALRRQCAWILHCACVKHVDQEVSACCDLGEKRVINYRHKGGKNVSNGVCTAEDK